MNDYIVKVDDKHPLSYNEWSLVKSETKKEAINEVHRYLGKGYFKKDLKAYTLFEFYDNSNLKVIH